MHEWREFHSFRRRRRFPTLWRRLCVSNVNVYPRDEDDDDEEESDNDDDEKSFSLLFENVRFF